MWKGGDIGAYIEDYDRVYYGGNLDNGSFAVAV